MGSNPTLSAKFFLIPDVDSGPTGMLAGLAAPVAKSVAPCDPCEPEGNDFSGSLVRLHESEERFGVAAFIYRKPGRGF